MQPFTDYSPALFAMIIMAAYYSSSSVTAAVGEELTFDCTIRQIASMPARGEPTIPHQTVCKKEDSESYISLDGNIHDFFFASSFPLELGQTRLSIPTSLLIDGEHLDLDNPRASESIVISRRNNRQATNYRVGTWNVLAIRVIDSTGDAPTKSRMQLGTDIFDDSFNLVSY